MSPSGPCPCLPHFPLLSSSPLRGPSPPPPLVVTVGPEHLQSAHSPQHRARGWEAAKGKVLWIIHLWPSLEMRPSGYSPLS